MIYPIDRLEEGRWPRLLAADLAYVFVRNAAIYSLANSGKYEFCYRRLVDQVGDARELDSSEVATLHKLRESKFAYRSRDATSTEFASVEEVRNVCAKVHPGYAHKPIGIRVPIRLFDVGYATLRDVEAKLISIGDVPGREQEGARSGQCDIWRMLTRPRDYSWNIRQIIRG